MVGVLQSVPSPALPPQRFARSACSCFNEARPGRAVTGAAVSCRLVHPIGFNEAPYAREYAVGKRRAR